MEFSYYLRSVAADDIIFSGPGLGSSANCFIADIINIADYSPLGVQLDCLSRIFIGRRTMESDSYRYGFQGQETDDEIKGEGNSVNYKYRMHDPRIGRFFAIDPLAPDYPMLTPYQFGSNRPIDFLELEGLEGVPAIVYPNRISYPKLKVTQWHTINGVPVQSSFNKAAIHV